MRRTIQRFLDGYPSPAFGFFLVVVSVFVTEYTVMLVYSAIGVTNQSVTDLVDASILAIVVSVVSYYAVVRPLIRSREYIRHHEKRLRAIFDYSVIGIAIVDKGGQLIETNHAFQRMLGYAEGELTNLHFDNIVHHDDLHHSSDFIHKIVTEHQEVGYLEKRYLHKNGTPVWCKDHVSVIRDREDILFFCIMTEDVSLLYEAEYEKRLATSLFKTSAEAMVITDSDNHIIKVNPAFTKITGYAYEEAIGKNPKVLSSGHHGAAFYAILWETLLKENHWCGDIWNRHKDGHLYAQRVTMSLIRDHAGKIINHIAVFSDVTHEKRKNEEIRHQAQYDTLTNLPNRSLMWERLLMVFPSTMTQRDLALMFIDLDGFKGVNDQYGHRAGDQLLQIVAERLKRSTRHSDTVARIGGDEFVVIVHERSSHLAARKISESILRSLQNQIRIDDHEITIGASIGVSVFPDDGVDPETLLAAADAAMYRAKQSGKNTVCFHSDQSQYNRQSEFVVVHAE